MYVGILIDAGPIAAATAAAVVAGGTTPTGLVTSHSVGTATLGKLGHPCVPQENEIVARKNKIIYQIIGTYLSTSSFNEDVILQHHHSTQGHGLLGLASTLETVETLVSPAFTTIAARIGPATASALATAFSVELHMSYGLGVRS